jgi:hypothetical protein
MAIGPGGALSVVKDGGRLSELNRLRIPGSKGMFNLSLDVGDHIYLREETLDGERGI